MGYYSIVVWKQVKFSNYSNSPSTLPRHSPSPPHFAYKNRNSVGVGIETIEWMWRIREDISPDKNSEKKTQTQSVSKLNSYVAVYRITRKAF